MANVCVIGGTGLISTGVVNALIEKGNKVSVFNRGRTDNRLPDGVELIVGDRNDPACFGDTLAQRHFDAVIDMICFNPDQAARDIKVFAGHCEHFIFTSTVCTYGDTQTIIPTPENTPQNPHSEYGKNKLACEKLFLDAHAAGKMNVTIFRPSHTYGPGGGIINNLGWADSFVDRLRKGRPIIVSGDGHGLWQSAFSEDVGVGFANAVLREKCFGQIYNIVGEEVVAWDQYTQRTARAIGAPEPEIVHIPTDTLLAIKPADYFTGLAEIFRYHGVYSNEKIHRDIPEYRLRTSFEEGVRRTVAWLDQHNKIGDSDKDRLPDVIVEQWRAMVAAAKSAI